MEFEGEEKGEVLLFILNLLVVDVNALASKNDQTVLSLGACMFSLGALIVAGGLYTKARVLAAQPVQAAPAERASGVPCGQCHSSASVVDCKVHNIHLCGDCLGEHYDFRSCAYVPTTRRGTRLAKATVKAAGR